MAKKTEQFGNNVIVYDDQIVSQISPELFAAENWQDSEEVMGQGGRHGAVRFVRNGKDEWAMRRYYRGGLIGHFLRERYIWTGAEQSRSFREWNLLQDMCQQKLPVPVPVAARCEKQGLFYTADLMTVRISDVVPLTSRMDASADAALWNAVGACVARFHNAGFYHPDLTTHNIQVNAGNEIWVLDWDKGDHREPAGWLADNLSRLQRSCNKVSDDAGQAFPAAHWDAFLESYYASLTV